MHVLTSGFEHSSARTSPASVRTTTNEQAATLCGADPRMRRPHHTRVDSSASLGKEKGPMHVLSEARPLLLASASPRRREILASLRIPTLVAPVEVDEKARL